MTKLNFNSSVGSSAPAFGGTSFSLGAMAASSSSAQTPSFNFGASSEPTAAPLPSFGANLGAPQPAAGAFSFASAAPASGQSALTPASGGAFPSASFGGPILAAPGGISQPATNRDAAAIVPSFGPPAPASSPAPAAVAAGIANSAGSTGLATSLPFGTNAVTSSASATPSQSFGTTGIASSASAAPSLAFGSTAAQSTASTGSATTALNFGAALGGSTLSAGVASPAVSNPPETAAKGASFSLGGGLVPATTAVTASKPPTASPGPAAASSSAAGGSTAAAAAAATNAASIAPTSSPATATGTPGPLDLPSEIKDLKLDEVTNKWSDEIEDLVERFRKQAIQVGRWDRQLLTNEDRIITLHKESNSLMASNKELDMNIDAVLGQQKELNNLLNALETEVERSSFAVNNISQSGGDKEREEIHDMTLRIGSQLDGVAGSLRGVVEDINKEKAAKQNDVVGQVMSVLNSHLTSLQHLDDQTARIGNSLQEAARLSDNLRRDVTRLDTREEFY